MDVAQGDGDVSSPTLYILGEQHLFEAFGVQSGVGVVSVRPKRFLSGPRIVVVLFWWVSAIFGRVLAGCCWSIPSWQKMLDGKRKVQTGRSEKNGARVRRNN